MPQTIYGNQAGFFARFNSRISSADVLGTWLPDASLWLEAGLGDAFISPFTSTNLTAIRLAYQKAWHLCRLSTIDPNDSDEMGRELEKELKLLRDGTKAMVLDDGTKLFAAKQHTAAQDEVWSTGDGYWPTFDERAGMDQSVDPDLLRNLYNTKR